MNKTTIELDRIKETTVGVGHMGVPFDGPAILDRLVEWSQQPENTGCRIYRHVVRSQDENIRHEPHYWSNGNTPYSHKSDYVTYLDIYYQ